MTTNVTFKVPFIQNHVDAYIDVIDFHSGTDVVVETIPVIANIDITRYLTTTRKLVIRENLKDVKSV